MQLVADLHIHSRFSRATSKNLDFVSLAHSALAKGVQLLGTGDFTHPGWFEEIQRQLEPAEPGLFKLKDEFDIKAREGLPAACKDGWLRFVLQVEISNIYKRDDAVRKNHNLVYVPSLEAATRFNEKLASIGNIASDGRPILGLDARDLLEITLETDPLAFLIPAHIWTPWFSMLGSKSGFDSLQACFRDLSRHVFAAETGLSSDPPMNWRVSELDRLTLVSNSDAHSAAKIAREANLLDIDPSFESLRRAIETGQGFLGTIEFFPEEGKYHLDGHRKCGVRLTPERTRELNGICPVCGKPLTVGVMSRVLDLADREDGRKPDNAKPFESLVGLHEVAAEVLGVGPGSSRVQRLVNRLLESFGSELQILRQVPLDEVERQAGDLLAEGIRRIRNGDLELEPGFDGEFGKIRIFGEGERETIGGQTELLALAPKKAPRRRKPSAPKQTAKSKQEPPKQSAEAPLFDNQHEKPSAQPWLDGADAEQREAIQHARGPLLIQAGPGSGKTRTLAARVVQAMVSNEWTPGQILPLTFSRQAALELSARIQKMLPQPQNRAPAAMTFHSFGKSLLERHQGHSVAVASEEQREEWARQIASTIQSDVPWSAGDVLDMISSAKQSASPEEHLEQMGASVDAFRAYEHAKKEAGVVDLDDLVSEAVRLLDSNENLREEVRRQYRMICVDEYQDINDVQARFIQLLSPTGENLTAIGDPDQAIYGFRGSKPEHFVRFTETFSDATTIRLRNTYRLTNNVARAASALLGHEQPLVSHREGPAIELVQAASPRAEAERVVIRMEQLLGGTSSFAIDSGRSSGDAEANVGLGDMAVLVRTRAQRAAVLEAFEASSIPCRQIGEDEPHDPRAQKVSIMTMHASKGREFEVVFVLGLEKGLMPLELEGFTTDPDEERRLLYVAMTRARTYLVLSHARSRVLFGKRLPGAPSPLLERIPQEVTRKRTDRRKHNKNGQLSLF